MREYFIVIWMACKDLRHDVRMTLCLVLTVAAIALPLLLFFGLKNGVVEVMRQRMINEPSFMEIIAQGTKSLDDVWFTTWRKNPHVGFLVPRTRELGVTARFSKVTQAGQRTRSIKADMQPSGKGDWLLQSYRTPEPKQGQCVLTAGLAQKLNAQTGDSLSIQINRQKKSGGMEYATVQTTVAAVLPQQASGRDMAFVPLAMLENTEAYRDGFAVEAYGWEGVRPLAYPVYYRALLYTPKALDPILKAQIQQRSGFINMENWSVKHTKILPQIPSDWHITHLSTGNIPVNAFKFNELHNLLRGKTSVLVPLAGNAGSPLQLSLYTAKQEGQQRGGFSLYLTSTPLWTAPNLNNSYPLGSPWKEEIWKKTPAAGLLVNPAVVERFQHEKVVASFYTKAGAEVRMPMQLVPMENISAGMAYASPFLVGQLNLLLERPLTVGAMQAQGKEVSLLLGRKNYSRFRMYARSLDAVAPLAAALNASGLPVKTRVADIERVRRMDQYLSLILTLIAGAAIIGGTVALLSSLYASVERKRRSLAVLRLLGIHGITLCAFPLTAGMVMTFMGICLSLVLYHLVGFYINYLAQDFILPGEVLCHLTLAQQLWALLWAFIASVIAGLAASRNLLKIEPAEGLRDE